MVSGWSPANVRPVRVHVAFTPGEATRVPRGIVVDVLRATSTIVQALEVGYGAVYCCAEIGEAQALKEKLGDAVLGGERRGRSPARLRPRELPARIPRATSGGRRPHDDERHAGGCARRGELRPRPRRKHAEPGRSCGCGARQHGEDVEVVCAGLRGGYSGDDAYCGEAGSPRSSAASRRPRPRKPWSWGGLFRLQGGGSHHSQGRRDRRRGRPRPVRAGRASPPSSLGSTGCAARPRG
jgi:hypothetical protein